MDMNRDAYQQRLEAQMKEWNARIDVLKAKADKASAQAKIEMRHGVDELTKLQRSAKDQLDRIRSASSETWDEVQSELEVAWKHLTIAADRLWSKVS